MYNCEYEKNKIEVADAVWQNDKIWFISKNYSSLFYVNLRTEEIILEAIIPNEKYNQSFSFVQLQIVENKIVIIPHFSKYIFIYDIIEKMFKEINIKEEICTIEESKRLFIGSNIYGKYVFIFPALATTVIRLDVEECSITYIDGWFEEIEKKIKLENYFFFSRQNVIVDGKIYAPFCNMNAVMELDCESLKYKIHNLGVDNWAYLGICSDGKNFWLPTTKENILVRWDFRNNIGDKILAYETTENKNKNHCLGIIFYDNTLRIYSRKVQENETIYMKDNVEYLKGAFLFIKEYDDYIIYFEKEQGELTLIDKKGDIKKVIKIAINIGLIEINKIYEEKKILVENEELKLINLLLGMKKKKNVKYDQDANIGEQIHKLINDNS